MFSFPWPLGQNMKKIREISHAHTTRSNDASYDIHSSKQGDIIDVDLIFRGKHT